MLMRFGMLYNPPDALKFADRQRVGKPDPASITTNPSHETHGFDPFDPDQHSRTNARRFAKPQTAAGSGDVFQTAALGSLGQHHSGVDFCCQPRHFAIAQFAKGFGIHHRILDSIMAVKNWLGLPFQVYGKSLNEPVFGFAPK